MPKARLDYIETLNERGKLYWKRNRINEAIALRKEALEIGELIIDANHPQMALLYNNLAVTYDAAGEHHQALDLYEKSLSIIDEKKDPVNHAIGLINIAECYYRLRNIPKAIEIMNNALRIYEQNLPPRHEYIIDARTFLLHFQTQMEATS